MATEWCDSYKASKTYNRVRLMLYSIQQVEAAKVKSTRKVAEGNTCTLNKYNTQWFVVIRFCVCKGKANKILQTNCIRIIMIISD